MPVRSATHAGSWYSADKRTLESELDDWLSDVPEAVPCIRSGRLNAGGSVNREIDASAETKEGENSSAPCASETKDVPVEGARAIIAPHAGHAYSGPAAAWAYKALDLSKAKRIFLLGPSHHAYLPGCALSRCDAYETPLGNLSIDIDTISQLHKTKAFDKMSLSVDEAEHSLELHLPHIYRMLQRTFQSPSFFPSLIPILVGATDEASERQFGRILAPYLSDPTSIFIVSSDFCHWGSRFRYTYYEPAAGSGLPPQRSLRRNVSTDGKNGAIAAAIRQRPIYESIAAVDGRCMDAVEGGSHSSFLQVLEETGNTVCGRHPIGIVMAALEEIRKGEELSSGIEREKGKEKGKEKEQGKFKFTFVRYERSSDVVSVGDSSVSYCSAFAVL